MSTSYLLASLLLAREPIIDPNSPSLSISNVISHIPWIWPFLQAIPNADASLEVPRTVCKNLVSKRMETSNIVKRDLYSYLVTFPWKSLT